MHRGANYYNRSSLALPSGLVARVFRVARASMLALRVEIVSFCMRFLAFLIVH